MYVSNTTNRLDRDLCFKDSSFTISTIPAVFTTNCTKHGHYVIYHNERLSGTSYPADYSPYAYNDLCEVEVYGMLKDYFMNQTSSFSFHLRVMYMMFCVKTIFLRTHFFVHIMYMVCDDVKYLKFDLILFQDALLLAFMVQTVPPRVQIPTVVTVT